MSTNDWNARQIAARKKNIREALEEKDFFDVSLSIWNASFVAEWVNFYPSIVAKYFKKYPVGFETLRDRLKFPIHSLPFRSNQARDEVVEHIRAAVGTDSGEDHVRVEGQAGVGKSRVVMEALRDRADLTLYAESPPESHEPLVELVSDRKSAIVVLDECDYGTAKNWEQRVVASQGRMKLVTIGTNEEWAGAGEGVIELPILGREELVEVARDNAPTLEEHELEWVAEVSEGFVKLAGPLAIALGLSDKATAAALIEDRDVVEVLRKLVGGDAEYRAMTGSRAVHARGF